MKQWAADHEYSDDGDYDRPRTWDFLVCDPNNLESFEEILNSDPGPILFRGPEEQIGYIKSRNICEAVCYYFRGHLGVTSHSFDRGPTPFFARRGLL